jgi:hypothetical protein
MRITTGKSNCNMTSIYCVAGSTRTILISSVPASWLFCTCLHSANTRQIQKTHFSKHIDYYKSQSFLAEQPPFSINVSNSWHLHIYSHAVLIKISNLCQAQDLVQQFSCITKSILGNKKLRSNLCEAQVLNIFDSFDCSLFNTSKNNSHTILQNK